jgi:hypothetical protein
MAGPKDAERLKSTGNRLDSPGQEEITKNIHRFIDLADHLGPALGGEGPELLLNHPYRNRHQARLFDLPSMGIGVEAVISDSDLALVGNMGSHSGDELQVVHPLGLSGFFPVPVGDSAFPFIQGEALLPTVGTADAGKSATGVAAIEVALHDLLDDRPKEAVWLLKAALVLD